MGKGLGIEADVGAAADMLSGFTPVLGKILNAKYGTSMVIVNININALAKLISFFDSVGINIGDKIVDTLTEYCMNNIQYIHQ